EESTGLLARLRGLTVVEPFPARGATSVNVHESARLALRKAMAADRIRALSSKAAARFGDDLKPAGRVEWIYHLLYAEPDRGATELEKLDRDWLSSAHPEDLYALAAALQELENSRMVHGRARAWALLAIAWAAVSRGETTQQANVAQNVLRLAREAKDQRA